DFGGGDLFVAMGLRSFFPNAKIVAVDSAYLDSILESLRSSQMAQGIQALRSLDAWTPQKGEEASGVLMLDVLEHCASDTEILAMVRDSGKVLDNTTWVITVPAWQWLSTRHDTFLGHYRRYSLPRLKRALTVTDLKPVTQGYFFACLLLPR